MPDDIREWYPSCPGVSLRTDRLRAPGRVTTSRAARGLDQRMYPRVRAASTTRSMPVWYAATRMGTSSSVARAETSR